MRTYFSVIWHVEGVIDDLRQLRFSLNTSKQVQNYPNLKDANFRLTPLLFVNSSGSKIRKKKKLSRDQQAEKYSKLLASGEVKSRAELARKFGVSRAWVSIVLALCRLLWVIECEFATGEVNHVDKIGNISVATRSPFNELNFGINPF